MAGGYLLTPHLQPVENEIPNCAMPLVLMLAPAALDNLKKDGHAMEEEDRIYCLEMVRIALDGDDSRLKCSVSPAR
jgi:hypothetical protein